MLNRFFRILALLLFLAAFFLTGFRVDTSSAWDAPLTLVMAGLASLAASFHDWQR